MPFPVDFGSQGSQVTGSSPDAQHSPGKQPRDADPTGGEHWSPDAGGDAGGGGDGGGGGGGDGGGD
jgi:hypothetical protein